MVSWTVDVLIEINASVGEFAERSLLLELGRLLGILDGQVRCSNL